MNRLQVVCDFDGIMSGMMLFNDKVKSAKQLQYGVRHAIDMLNWFDCDVHVLTGDSTKAGQAMTKTMLANCNIKSIIYCKHDTKLRQLVNTFGDISNIVYIADDLHDITIAECVGNFITTASAIDQLKQAAVYVSHSGKLDYAYLDIAMWIVSNLVFSMPMLYTKQPLSNSIATTRLRELAIKSIYIVGAGKDDTAESYYTWFDTTLTHVFGMTIEQLIAAGYTVEYVCSDIIAHPIETKETLFVVHYDVLSKQFKRLKHLRKLYVDFSQMPFADVQAFLQNMQTELLNDTARSDMQRQLMFGFFGAEYRAALLTDSTISGVLKAYVDGISALDNDEATEVLNETATYSGCIYRCKDCHRDTKIVQ